jgi:hypothetical protein
VYWREPSIIALIEVLFLFSVVMILSMLFRYIGIASALVFVMGDIPYLLDTFKGKTQPHRVTWGVLALLNAIGFANQYAIGANNSLWLFGAGTLLTGLIFIESIHNGAGGRTNTDMICLVIGLAGIILWLIFKSPLYSVFSNIIADIAALWPTYKKARLHPESETRISWLVGTISIIMAAISVGKLDWRLLLLPVASILLQAYIVYELYLGSNVPVKSSKRKPAL